MLFKHVLLLLGCCLSCTSFAGFMGEPSRQSVAETFPWLITGSLGYANLSDAYGGQGQTAVGRVAAGKILGDLDSAMLGFEVGFQNGTTMQLQVSQAALKTIGGVPVSVTVNPLLDLLGTLRFMPVPTANMFADVKLGVAYRRMNVLIRETVNNKSQFAAEVQAGLGVPIMDMMTVSLLYQGIYGSSVDFQTDAATRTGFISNIPVQNGLLLSLSVAF